MHLLVVLALAPVVNSRADQPAPSVHRMKMRPRATLEVVAAPFLWAVPRALLEVVAAPSVVPRATLEVVAAPSLVPRATLEVVAEALHRLDCLDVFESRHLND